MPAPMANTCYIPSGRALFFSLIYDWVAPNDNFHQFMTKFISSDSHLFFGLFFEHLLDLLKKSFSNRRGIITTQTFELLEKFFLAAGEL